ncbi:MAG: hypothetical protein JSW27_03305 [Phycisphaerales bacterium]|nr:MAG: hypothetical protein JSW27_03305 [Phycisphaerales bacterium]
MKEAEKAITFGLDSEKVIRLLQIAAERPQPDARPDEPEVKAELLRDKLAETLSLYEAQSDELPARQTQMACAIADLAGDPIGELLLDPATDLALIRRIKDHGRKISESANSTPERHVGNAIYYAAIAAALLFHGTHITTHSSTDLNKSLQRLASETWISDSLSRLFGKARTVIEQRRRS